MSDLDAHHRWVDVIGTNADGSLYVGQMVEADFAPTRQVHEAWEACAKCAHVAPRSEMRKRNGAWLCVENGCAMEADA